MLAQTFEMLRLRGMCTVEERIDGAFQASSLTEPFVSILATRRLPRFGVHRFKPKFEGCRSSRFRQFSSLRAVVRVSPFAFAM